MREVTYSNPRHVREEGAIEVPKKKATKKPEKPAAAPPPGESQPAESTATEFTPPTALTDSNETKDADPEKDAVNESLEDLKKQRDKYKTQFESVLGWKHKLQNAQSKVARAEAAFAEADAARKKCKAAVETAIANELGIVAKFIHGEQLLPLDDADDEPAPGVVNSTASVVPALGPDPAEAELINVLLGKNMKKIVGADEFNAAKDRGEPIGMTEKQLEVLEGMGWDTIGKFEKAIRENSWWHRDLKGFGPDKIDRLTITLAAFRRVYPMPVLSEIKANQAAQPASSEPAEPTSAAAEIPEWESAIERIESLLKTANDLMHNGPGECVEFMESVTVEATSMLTGIREHESVTEDQQTAITNWTEGVAKWQPAS